jgi:hypothetical protein
MHLDQLAVSAALLQDLNPVLRRPKCLDLMCVCACVAHEVWRGIGEDSDEQGIVAREREWRVYKRSVRVWVWCVHRAQ